MSETKTTQEFALLRKDFDYMKKDIHEIKEEIKSLVNKLNNKYVSKDELERELLLLQQQINLIQKIVYGFVGLILSAVVVAWVSVIVI